MEEYNRVQSIKRELKKMIPSISLMHEADVLQVLKRHDQGMIHSMYHDLSTDYSKKDIEKAIHELALRNSRFYGKRCRRSKVGKHFVMRNKKTGEFCEKPKKSHSQRKKSRSRSRRM